MRGGRTGPPGGRSGSRSRRTPRNPVEPRPCNPSKETEPDSNGHGPRCGGLPFRRPGPVSAPPRPHRCRPGPRLSPPASGEARASRGEERACRKGARPGRARSRLAAGAASGTTRVGAVSLIGLPSPFRSPGRRFARRAGPCFARIARGRRRVSAPARFARLIARARAGAANGRSAGVSWDVVTAQDVGHWIGGARLVQAYWMSAMKRSDEPARALRTSRPCF